MDDRRLTAEASFYVAIQTVVARIQFAANQPETTIHGGISRPIHRVGPVASPGFVARRGKDGNYVMGALTVDFRAGCSSCSITNNIMINAVLIERAVMSY